MTSAWVAFGLATALLMLIPGPNVALIVTTSVRHGTRSGLLTVAGTASAMVVQLVVLVLGLSGLLGVAGHAFGWLRWLGAAYLVTLGILSWRARATALDAALPRPSVRGFWARAFFVSLSNPKTLLFYAAFFPQFLARGHVAGQVAILSATFLALAVLIDSGWALAAGRVRPWLAGRARLANRLSGMVLIGAGVALARRSA